MPLIEINGTALHYEDTGPGRDGGTVMFSHGLLWSAAMWAAQVEALRERFRCIAYDHRGQGRSADSDLRCIDMDLLAADAARLIEALDAAPVHFCGLSMGGFVGLRLAARRPDLIASLILLDTTAGTDPATRALQYRLLNVAARAFGLAVAAGPVLRIMVGRSTRRDPSRTADLRRWRAQIVGNRPSFWRAVNGVLERADVTGELHRIVAPTLVIVGAEDEPFPPPEAERLCRGIEGARLVGIPRCGHMSAIEQPGPVNRAILAFLGDVEAARRPLPCRAAG